MPWIKCLGGGGGKARRGKPLSVSQPIHLLVKSDFEPQCHVFHTKQLRKPRPCHLCHQAVIKQASCCRVCKYICHKTCEDKFKATRDAVWISRTSENLRGACGELHHNAEEEKEKRSMRQQQSREEMSREPCRWAM